MESISVLSWEQKTLISELVHGMEVAKRLKLQLGAAASSAETKEILVQQIVSSYEKALLLMKWNGPAVQQSQLPRPSSGIPESAASINGSPRSEDFDGGIKDYHQDSNYGSKKRKMLPRRTEQVRINPERGLEGPQDDGYSWRKYGQKDILGAKYPRSYYRCTYRNTQNCWATKQVQRSDDDPMVFEVTYRGTHTCSQVIPPPASLEKHDIIKPKPNVNYQQDILESLRNNLTVDTMGLDTNDDNTQMAPNAFSFPATSFNSCQTSMDNGFAGFCHVGCSNTLDFPGLISANTSTGSSPIFDIDFSLDPTVEIDTSFPFENPILFS